MHDGVPDLTKTSLRSSKLDPKHPDLLSRHAFISQIEKDFKTTKLKQKHVNVNMSDGTEVLVSVFNIAHNMILSLVLDKSYEKRQPSVRI